MKPVRVRMPLRLKGALFALSIAAMATQAGSAPLPPRAAEPVRAAHLSAASVLLSGKLAGKLAPLGSLGSVLHGQPVSGGWALLFAGLTGIWAIGRRRTSTLGSQILEPQRLRRQ